MSERVVTPPDTFLEMAAVGRPWGREGAVAVTLSTDRPEERFRPGMALEAREGGTTRSLTVSWWRPRGEGGVVKFQEVVDIDGAERLRGARLGLERGATEALFGPRELLDDLRGLAVESTTGERLGVVADLEDAGPQTLMVVKTSAGEVLVPLHDHLCPVIDITGGRVVVDPPDGMFPCRED